MAITKYTELQLMEMSAEAIKGMCSECRMKTSFTPNEVFIIAQVLNKFGLEEDIKKSLFTLSYHYYMIFKDDYLTSGSLRAFLSRGIPLVSYLCETFKVSEDGFFRILREGLISFKDVKLTLFRIFYTV